MKKKRVSISWSGGKDAALALYKIQQANCFEVVNLHTVIDEKTKRVGLHGVRESIIDRQAACIGLPLQKLYLSPSSDGNAYEHLMKSFYRECIRDGFEGIVFGDLFLEEIRAYRLNLLDDLTCEPVFPLWGVDTNRLFEEFIHTGFKTVICSANADFFLPKDLGTTLDMSFPATLKPGVDVCGENGEFHTLVYDGPIFSRQLLLRKGEIVKKSYTYNRRIESGGSQQVETSFWFQDYLLGTD